MHHLFTSRFLFDLIIVEIIGRHEACDDDNADNGDGDAALSADDSALQWKTHGDVSLQREQQHEVGRADLKSNFKHNFING